MILQNGLEDTPNFDTSRKGFPLKHTTLKMHRGKKAIKALLASLEPHIPCGGSRHKSIPKLRIAVVKQAVYQDLYCCPARSKLTTLLSSTLRRSGPTALFTAHSADFFIVSLEDDPECQIWREKISDCKQGTLQSYLALAARTPSSEDSRNQGIFAVSAASVDWSLYDLVISFDIAVPERLVRLHTRTTWAYYIGEPCMRSYASSLLRPLAGYDLFLNQRFRRIRLFPHLRPHVVEFPYYLQKYGDFHSAFATGLNHERAGVFVEGRSLKELDGTQLLALSRFGPVRVPSGSINSLLQDLMASKYFLVLPARKWGNAMVEAVSAGCLALGVPKNQHNVSLFTSCTICSDFADSIRRIEHFEAHPNAYNAALESQRAKHAWLCYQRPMEDLLRKAALQTREAL